MEFDYMTTAEEERSILLLRILVFYQIRGEKYFTV
jgi:hypothetical protein